MVEAERSPREIAGLMVLTFTSGMVDAVGFIALGHVFCALATGNVLFLGIAVAGEPQLGVGNTVTALGMFAVGLACGHRLVVWLDSRGRRWFRTTICFEGIALSAAAGVSWGLVPEPPGQLSGRHYAVVALLALAMGARAVAAQRLAVPGMSTILITSTLSLLFKKAPPGVAGTAMAMHRRRYFVAVLSMLAGAAVATLLLEVSVPTPLLVTAACAFAVAVFADTGRAPGA